MPNINDLGQKNVSYIVERKDLPVCCPPKDVAKWNMHPRVFLKFNKQSQAICPYCSSKYELI